MGKYKLVDRFLILKNQVFKRIISKNQFYPLIYTFYNNPIVEYIGF